MNESSSADRIEQIRIDVAVIKSRLEDHTPHHPPCLSLQAVKRDVDALAGQLRDMREEARVDAREKARRWWTVALRAAPWLLAALAAAWSAGWRPA